MPQATKPVTSLRIPRVTLNSDGARHPLQNSLAVFTLVAGVAAFPLGFVVAQHVVASCLGIAALAVGLYAQMISATREERVIIVTGLVAGFVGLALGLAHGGFYP
jgi:FtsH-binding integral membrane protein